MKLRFAKIAIFTLSGLACVGVLWADELDDAYTALKEAQTNNKADDVAKWAPEVAKLSRAEAAHAKPADMKDEDWKARVEFAKGAETFAEYSLSAVAMQPTTEPAQVVALVDHLLTLNPKSQYLGQTTGVYLTSLEKSGGAAKSLEGANKLLAAQPNNEDALFAAMNGSFGKNNGRAEALAAQLIGVMRGKAKPEGVADADWNKKRSAMLGYAYYYAGIIPATASVWQKCDVNLRSGLSFIQSQPGLGGTALFYLGLCNYQISKITSDKGKLAEALQFTDQAAAISGPMQGQAQTNSAVMRRELGGAAARPAAPAAKGKAK
jgi:hypothetical protein